MWLLDANVDVLSNLLIDFGISCDTTANRGWKTSSNGDLVTVAVAAGFVCLLTRDQLFGQSAARALKTFPQFAVVVVNIPQQLWRQYRDRFVAQWADGEITPIAGELIQWP